MSFRDPTPQRPNIRKEHYPPVSEHKFPQSYQMRCNETFSSQIHPIFWPHAPTKKKHSFYYPHEPLTYNQFIDSPNASHQINHSNSGSIKVENIVKELATFCGFGTDVKKLARVLNEDYNDVKKIIKKYSKTFSMIQGESINEELVELYPLINLCQYYLGTKGCNGKCFAIHICASYLKSGCEDSECPFGHSLSTNHNENIIRAFFLTELSSPKLKKLLQKVFKDMPVAKICSRYNQNNCLKNEKCNELHICYSYVYSLGKCPNGISCEYSHNIKDEKCRSLLRSFGISLNESPRDLMKSLKDECSRYQQQQCTSKEKREDEKLSEKEEAKKEEPCTKIIEKDLERKTNDGEENESIKTSHQHIAHFLSINGNDEKPSVCVDFLNDKCTSNKCKYFHSEYPYHWQFGENSNWYNFHTYHVQILETNYGNPDCNNFILPKLSPKYIKKEMNQLFSLLGTKMITVNFSSMTIDCEGSGKIYSIRHLTTNSSVISNDKLSTVFHWYFMNNHCKWELYRESELSSQKIEKYFLQDPNSKCQIKSVTNNFPYEIDFLNMTQRNLITGNVRPLKRRPKPVSLVGEETEETKFSTPKHWSGEVDSNQIYQLVPVSSFSDEFRRIQQAIEHTLPMSEIVSILRIQNVHLCKIFQNKVHEFEQKYEDEFLDVLKLFHGIGPAHIKDICEKNLDFRFHDDPKTKKPYGNGTYFYSSAKMAAEESKSDHVERWRLLVVEVFIGKTTIGKRGMRRPPLREGYDDLYDTTVDNLKDPTVFCKFSSQEYYPSYIVEFSDE